MEADVRLGSAGPEELGRHRVPGHAATAKLAAEEPGDAGIGVTSVIVMLAVLAVLVVGIFWLVPTYFGGGVVEVTIRN